MVKKKKPDLYSQFLKIKKESPNFYLHYKKILCVEHLNESDQRNLSSKKKKRRIE
jgi:hypothetical protein